MPEHLDLVTVLSALADPIRLAIIDRLDHTACAGEALDGFVPVLLTSVLTACRQGARPAPMRDPARSRWDAVNDRGGCRVLGWWSVRGSADVAAVAGAACG